MRKAQAAAVFLALLLVCAAAVRAKGETFVSGGYEYALLDGGTGEITGYWGGPAESMLIPSELDGHPVTRIGGMAIYNDSLVTVTLPDSLRDIEYNPFNGCPRLANIIISPDHPYFEVVDGVLFGKADRRLICCPRAIAGTSYAIPDGTRVVGDFAFRECKDLVSVSFPASVTRIGNGAFAFCTALPAFTIPDTVTDIGFSAFTFCTSLASVGIPDSVKSIGDDAFSNCTSLASVTIPNGIKSIGYNTFANCASLASVTIPDSVTSIGNDAFYQCGSLVSINLPASVTSIGDWVFYGCSDWLTIGVSPDSCAEQYCIENALPFEYTDFDEWLRTD